MKDTITTTEGALTHVRHVFDRGIGVAVGHIEHLEPRASGWEFIAAATVDKPIFGIAEV